MDHPFSQMLESQLMYSFNLAFLQVSKVLYFLFWLETNKTGRPADTPFPQYWEQI